MNHCAICGGYPTFNKTLLCPICEQKSEKWFIPQTTGTGSFNLELLRKEQKFVEQQVDFAQLRVGFLWPPNQARAKVHLLHALKGNSCPRTWNLLAYRFVQRQRMLNEMNFKKRWLLLPIPSRHGLKQDHAWRWAEALAPLWGGHVLRVFKHENKGYGQQKQRSVQGRQELQLPLIREDLKEWLKQKSRRGWGLAVVDDVVTTGSTARAAWQALGQPPMLSIWALTYRLTLRNGNVFGYNAASKSEC